mgnify:CR=1 FL=1
MFTILEKAQRLRVVADQQVLGLLVVGQCQLVRFAADARAAAAGRPGRAAHDRGDGRAGADCRGHRSDAGHLDAGAAGSSARRGDLGAVRRQRPAVALARPRAASAPVAAVGTVGFITELALVGAGVSEAVGGTGVGAAVAVGASGVGAAVAVGASGVGAAVVVVGASGAGVTVEATGVVTGAASSA